MQKLFDKLNTTEKQCEIHGSYASTNYFGNIWTKCPDCVKEIDAKREREDRERRIKDRERRITEELNNRIDDACIPERFREKTIDTYIADSKGQKHAYEFSVNYTNNFKHALETGQSAIFVGKPGTGKTHLAIGIALSVMKNGNSSMFITVQRAIRMIRDTWAKGSNMTESEAISNLTYPDLLILDEVGVQFGSDYEKQILFDVINDRYENRRPTILISNIPAKDLAGYLGERVTDRLREDGGKLIQFDWESYRRK